MGELNALASGTESSYLPQLEEELELTPNLIRRRATEVRTKILHDYSHFCVVTIDKFFQRIIRSFLKELGIDANFTLELQTDSILDSATDRSEPHTRPDDRRNGRQRTAARMDHTFRRREDRGQQTVGHPRGYPQTGRRDFQRALQKPNCGLTAQRGVEPGTGRSDRAQPRCHEHDAEDWTGSVELNCRKRTHDRRFRLRQKRLYQLFRQNERRHRIRLRTARIGRARVG